MKELNEVLERTILIAARRSTVFRYFTDSQRFAAWWGVGSTIEAKRGGAVQIRFPGAVSVSGEVLEVVPNEKIVFTYGFDSGKPIPPGSSRVTVTLRDHPEGTELRLKHEFADAATRDEHIQGWRYQLALFANIASRDEHSAAAATVDEFFNSWNSLDSNARAGALERISVPDLRFMDMHSCTTGIPDLNAHIDAGKKFMPGLSITRDGDIQECQGTVLVRWIAKRTANQTEIGRGTNIFSLAPDGRIQRIIGFWNRA